MDLDVNTLFLVTMHVEIMLGLLLFFAWAQNFSKKALGCWGAAHIMRAASIMLFGLTGSVEEWVSIDLANALLFGSFALTWSGARIFDRRSAEPIWCLTGIAIWLLACRLPQFTASTELRVLVGSGIVTTYTWLAAYEFWRGRSEALVSRWPAIFMLFAHGALFLLRTPLGSLLHLSPTSQLSKSAWLELLSMEGLLFTISIAFILLAMAKERLEYSHREAARTDDLTGIVNRRGLLELITTSKQRSTAVILFDLDYFKRINDKYGHAVGDRALKLFADSAKLGLGSSGLVGRWGGDEFAAVIYDTAHNEPTALAERVRTAFERNAAEIDGRPTNATVSVGVVFCNAGPLDLPTLLVEADRTLYRAKERGRNRVEVSDQSAIQHDTGGVITSLEAHRRKAASAA